MTSVGFMTATPPSQILVEEAVSVAPRSRGGKKYGEEQAAKMASEMSHWLYSGWSFVSRIVLLSVELYWCAVMTVGFIRSFILRKGVKSSLRLSCNPLPS